MSRPTRLSDAALTRLVSAGNGTWRPTALAAAISAVTGCRPATAWKWIWQARDRGVIEKQNGFVVPTIAGPPPPTPPVCRYPAPSESSLQIASNSGRYNCVNRYQMLVLLNGRRWRRFEILDLVVEQFGASASSARANLDMARDHGYVHKCRDGRYELTSLGQTQVAQYGQLRGPEGLRFARFCSGRPNFVKKYDPAPAQ